MSQDAKLPADLTALPLLPLRDVVVFPHMVIPLFVGRPKSIKALDAAMDAGKHILLVAQKQAAKDDPGAEDLYEIGSIATVLQMLKLPDGTVKVLVEGVQRAKIGRVEDRGEYLVAEAEPMPGDAGSANEVEAMRRALLAQFDQFVKLNKKIPPEILTSMSGIDDGGRLADAIAAHLPLKLEQKQQILEMGEVGKRLEHLLGVLEGEVDILQVEKRIRGRVKRQMEKSQREYYLNEQVKAIQKELGEGDENADLDEMEKKVKAAKMSKEAESKALKELKKLKMMSPMSAEATVVRNYIDTLTALPGSESTTNRRWQAALEALRGRWPVEAIDLHLRRLPASYLLSTDPPTIDRHLALIARAAAREDRTALYRDTQSGVERLTVVTPDRPGILAAVAGTLAVYSVSVLGGVAYTRDDGVAIQVFFVGDALGHGLDERRWERVQAAVPQALADQFPIDERLAETRSAYRQPVDGAGIETSVTIDNLGSRQYSIVEVSTADRIGLLYAITRAMHDLALDIHVAKVDTIGREVVDAFYVRRENGRRVEEPDEIARVRSRIIAAIAELDG